MTKLMPMPIRDARASFATSNETSTNIPHRRRNPATGTAHSRSFTGTTAHFLPHYLSTRTTPSTRNGPRTKRLT
eukprot:12725289-Heterocapsa_arctica.AAC.1